MRNEPRRKIDSDSLARLRALAKPQRDLLTGETYLPPKAFSLDRWGL